MENLGNLLISIKLVIIICISAYGVDFFKESTNPVLQWLVIPCIIVAVIAFYKLLKHEEKL